MTTKDQTQIRECLCQCCGPSKGKNDAGGDNQAGQTPLNPGNGVGWTESVRPLGWRFVFMG